MTDLPKFRIVSASYFEITLFGQTHTIKSVNVIDGSSPSRSIKYDMPIFSKIDERNDEESDTVQLRKRIEDEFEKEFSDLI